MAMTEVPILTAFQMQNNPSYIMHFISYVPQILPLQNLQNHLVYIFLDEILNHYYILNFEM